MKKAFKLSLGLNVIFLLAAFLITTYRPKPIVLAEQVFERVERPDVGQTNSVVCQTNYPAASPFDWSQLESTNYRSYIANLRRVHCPEQTIRDLIIMDVDRLYTLRREQLHGSAPSDDGIFSQHHYQLTVSADMQRLNEEESLVLSSLLGTTPISRISNTGPASDSLRTGNNAREECVLPLVFQSIDLAALNLEPSRVEAIKRLRETFVQEIGGAYQDPGDPAYRAKWQTLQPEIDDLLRGMIGAEAYQEYELQARVTTHDAANISE